MDENTTLKQMRDQLDEMIPSKAVSEREGSGGMRLSYLEGHYVIDRLNKVLGQGNWQYETDVLTKVHDTPIEGRNNKKGRAVAYIATVRLTAEIANKVVTFSDVGAGKGIDYGFGIEADESAVKEAVTDGLKRCAKNLGMSMGLALYDKTQKNVKDEPDSGPAEAMQAHKITDTSFDNLCTLVRSYVKILEKKNKLQHSEFKERLTNEFKVERLNELSVEQLTKLRNELKQKAEE